MKKIRIGNDFVFNWAIERGGLPEDLSSVLEKRLHLSVFGKRVELIEGIDYDITGNVIRIEVTPTIANIIGTYKAEFHYILPDNGLIDDDRKCAVDVDAFQIVAKTAQADDSTEFSMTSDMAIAFKGDKGDSAYQVWLDAGNIGTEEDYFAYLRQPAIDAGASISELEGEIQASEGLRVQAESERDLAETTRIQSENERLASEIIRQSNEDNRIEDEDIRVQNEAERISEEGIRQSSEVDRVEAEGVRQSNEIDRIEAEGIREQAESERQITIQEAVTATNLANEKANLANVAAQNADEAADSALTATQEATTAASLADTARSEIQNDLDLKADQTDLVQLESDVSVKIANLIVNGDFRNGTTGWSTLHYSTMSVENNELTTIVTSRTANNRLEKQLPTVAGNKYYVRGEINPKYNTPTYFNFSGVISAQFPVVPSIWNALSAIGTATSDSPFRLFHRTDMNYAVGDAIKYRNMLSIDLTATFGAENEPTKEEMDLLISTLGIDYFEGEITIPAQKVMQWQLKMIRQNRIAIIALGGTIV